MGERKFTGSPREIIDAIKTEIVQEFTEELSELKEIVADLITRIKGLELSLQITNEILKTKQPIRLESRNPVKFVDWNDPTIFEDPEILDEYRKRAYRAIVTCARASSELQD